MARPRFTGSFCALVTPFLGPKRADGIDWAAFEAIVAWHLESGTHGLVPCGTTGETATLTDQEYEQVVAATIKLAGGKVPVIPGTGTNDTESTIARTQLAKRLGADAALVVTPYYNKPNQAGLLAHYTALAQAVDLPLIVYNVPGRTNVDLSVETLARLAELPTIVGVKDATADMARQSRHRALIGEDFSYLSGDDATTLGYMAHGGHGAISVTANAAPAECAKAINAALKGDYASALALQDALFPLHTGLFVETSPAPVKYAVARRGYGSDHVRLPLVPVSEAGRKTVDDALRHAGLL